MQVLAPAGSRSAFTGGIDCNHHTGPPLAGHGRASRRAHRLLRAVSQLKALGLVSEIIAWRLRLFVPTAEERGPAVLGAILDRRPLLGAKATVEQRLVGRDDLQGAGVAVLEIARNRGDQGRASRPSFLAGGNKGSIDPIPHRWHRLHSADHRGDTAAEWFLSTSCAPVQFGNQMDTQAVETTQFILGVLLGSLRRRW
jgi:hypothetical protein